MPPFLHLSFEVSRNDTKQEDDKKSGVRIPRSKTESWMIKLLPVDLNRVSFIYLIYKVSRLRGIPGENRECAEILG